MDINIIMDHMRIHGTWGRGITKRMIAATITQKLQQRPGPFNSIKLLDLGDELPEGGTSKISEWRFGDDEQAVSIVAAVHEKTLYVFSQALRKAFEDFVERTGAYRKQENPD